MTDRSFLFRPWAAAFVVILMGASATLFMVVRRHRGRAGLDGVEDGRALAAPSESSLPRDVAHRFQSAVTGARLDTIEHSLAGMQAKEASAAPAPSAEESFKKEQEAFALAAQAHRRDSVDQVWARKATESFQNGLNGLAKAQGFAVLGLDCRKQSCLATVEWENYGRATATYASIVTQDYALPCSAEMILAVPGEPGAKYRSEALFDCRSNQEP